MGWDLSETHLWLKGLTPAIKNELTFILQCCGVLRTPFLSSARAGTSSTASCGAGTWLSATCPATAAAASPAHLRDLARHDVTELWCHSELRTFVSEHLGGLSPSCPFPGDRGWWRQLVRGLGKNPENVICGEAGRAGSLLWSREETLLL